MGAESTFERPPAEAPLTQYEIWWPRLPQPVGRRPVLLLSRNSAYTVLHKVIVAEVTSTVRDIPVEVSSRTEGGLAAAVGRESRQGPHLE